MDIADFIRARLDEAEAVANAVHVVDKTPWHLLEWYDGEFEDGETARVDLRSRTGAITDQGALPRPVGTHIVLHDPARVLAEIAAKRAIVESEYAPYKPFTAQPTHVLRLLAALYADHPDYEPAWRIDD